MPLSDKTKTTVDNQDISVLEDLYPDRSATDNSLKGTGTISRLPFDLFPRTTYDMSELYQWQPGDKVRGSFAKSNVGMGGYIRDIQNAPSESEYKDKYIDTFKKVSDELKNSR